jgi:hypothetical protein
MDGQARIDGDHLLVLKAWIAGDRVMNRPSQQPRNNQQHAAGSHLCTDQELPGPGRPPERPYEL